MEYFDLLNRACIDSGVDFDENKYSKFMQYKDIIKEWNEKINLTAITDDDEIIKKHFIDSIKIFKFSPIKNAKNIIDIGTGAGLPGIPIKILFPEIRLVLLDSLRKRVNFLNNVISELNLKNIEAIHGRAEDFAQDKKYREKFDFAVSRAVANLSVLSEYCIPYVKVNGYFIALKGPSVSGEIDDSKNAVKILGGTIKEIIEVKIEDTDLEHNLVVISKNSSTSVIYPRKAGTANKNPLT